MADTYLEIAALALTLPGAWETPDEPIARLIGQGPAKRGDNRAVDDAPGQIEYPPEIDQTLYDMTLLVYGERDHLGVSHASMTLGLRKNLAHLRTTLAMPTAALPAILHLDDATTMTASVQVLNWMVTTMEGALVIVTYDLLVPAGVFT